jgi:hypothetical protein
MHSGQSLPLKVAGGTREFIDTTIEAECVQGGNVRTYSDSQMTLLDPYNDASRQSRSPSEIFLPPPPVHSGRSDIGADPGYYALDRRGCCAGP